MTTSKALTAPRLVAAHSQAQKIMWKGVLTAAILVLVFQIASTGWYMFTQQGQGKTILFWVGCGVGLVIAALEYALIEGLRGQWDKANSDSKLTIGEIIVLLGVLSLILGVAVVDVYSTASGAMALGFPQIISRIWAIGQLFAFEFLFNAAFHIRDSV